MSHHLPECFLSNPCRNKEGHSIITVVGGVPLGRDLCEACMADCICYRLRKAEQRGREAVLTAMSGEIDTAFAAGLKAAREAVEAENKNPISRVTTDYDIGYRDGTNDTVRLHLRAIDALTTSGKGSR